LAVSTAFISVEAVCLLNGIHVCNAMKPDPEYTRKLLTAFQDAAEPTLIFWSYFQQF